MGTAAPVVPGLVPEICVNLMSSEIYQGRVADSSDNIHVCCYYLLIHTVLSVPLSVEF